MIKQDDKRAFLSAVNDTLFKQIAPLIFTPQQLREMEQPYHKVEDHLAPAHAASARPEYGFLLPQLRVEDPRIDDSALQNMPQTFDVDFNGVTYQLPLRVYKARHLPAVDKWQDDLDEQYVLRAFGADLERTLSDEFRDLTPGDDFSVTFNKAVNGNLARIELMSHKPLAYTGAMVKHVEKRAANLPKLNIKRATVIGPLQPY